MLIDAHAHADGSYGTVESILGLSAQYGIERIVLCPTPHNIHDQGAPPKLPIPETPNSVYLLNRLNRFAYRHFLHGTGDSNEFVHELALALPDLVIPFIWVDPLDPRLDDLDAMIVKFGARGIKLHQAWNPFHVDSRQFRRVVDVARSRGLPIFLHLYSASEVRSLIRFVSTQPHGDIIVAHLIGYELFAKSGVDLSHLYFDTSSSNRISGQDILRAVEAFGHERVLFGTDNPYAEIGPQIARIDSLGLSTPARENIMRHNAARLLGLSP